MSDPDANPYRHEVASLCQVLDALRAQGLIGRAQSVQVDTVRVELADARQPELRQAGQSS